MVRKGIFNNERGLYICNTYFKPQVEVEIEWKVKGWMARFVYDAKKARRVGRGI